MPGPIAAAQAGDKLGTRISGMHAAALLLLAVAAAAIIFAAARKSPMGGPKVRARDSEDIPPFIPPPAAPMCGVDQHIGGIIYTPHRYPRMVGGEISAVIHKGHATLRIPHSADITWLTRPPSEVTL